MIRSASAPGTSAPFPRIEPEHLRRVQGADARDVLDGDAAGVDPERHQHRQEVLEPAAVARARLPDVPVLRPALGLGGVRAPAGAVIGPEARDAAVVKRPPEPVDVGGRAERRVHLAPAADLVLHGPGVREVMRGHLGPDRPALTPGGGDPVCALRASTCARCRWARPPPGRGRWPGRCASTRPRWAARRSRRPRSARPPAVSSVSSTSMMSMSSQWTMQMPGAPRSAQNRSERSTIPASDGPPSQDSPSVGRGL